MPDISMCDNKKCDKRNKCYRYKAIPDTYQSYACFESDVKDECFIPIKIDDYVYEKKS